MPLYPTLPRQQSSESATNREGIKNHQSMILRDHHDKETLPALAHFLEVRIRRHKDQYSALRKQEKEFFSALWAMAVDRNRMRQENDELKKDLHAQRILSKRQTERISELETQITEAKEILDNVKHHLERKELPVVEDKLKSRLRKYLSDDFVPKRRSRPSVGEPLEINSLDRETDYLLRRTKKVGKEESEWPSRFERSMKAKATAPVLSSSSSSDAITHEERHEERHDERVAETQRYPWSLPDGKPGRSRFDAGVRLPPFNMRHQGIRARRSRSADGDRTVVQAHKNHVPVGSALKPVIPNGKLVTAPPSPSKLKKSSKFLLIDQKSDENADVETELWYGKVVPTAGQPSGSAVIFETVEKHHFENAVPKRYANVAKSTGWRMESISREELQKRCAMSSGHAATAKKPPSPKNAPAKTGQS